MHKGYWKALLRIGGLLMMMASGFAQPPEIHIVNLHPGDTVVHGTVAHVNRDSVWVVVWVVTDHWYVQYLCNNHLTSVNPDDTWSCPTHLPWDRVVALLVSRSGYHPVLPCENWDHPSLEAGVLAWDGQLVAPTLSLSGYTWIRKFGERLDPDSNHWLDRDAWVDSAGLHLQTSDSAGFWWCSEVILDHSLGYGTYTFQLARRVDALDNHAVFAGFTYETIQREIDLEFSHALMPPPDNAQYVVQPFADPARIHHYIMPGEAATSHRLVWTRCSVQFTSWRGWAANADSTTLIQSWTFTGDSIPPPGHEHLRFNLWLHASQAPQHSDEVVVRSFTFAPVGPPCDVTVRSIGGDIRLQWLRDPSPYYWIYSDASFNGTFSNRLGSVADTTFYVPNGSTDPIRFYRVVGSTIP